MLEFQCGHVLHAWPLDSISTAEEELLKLNYCLAMRGNPRSTGSFTHWLRIAIDVGLDELEVESKLEEALISRLQEFLLELGSGFAFVGRHSSNGCTNANLASSCSASYALVDRRVLAIDFGVKPAASDGRRMPAGEGSRT